MYDLSLLSRISLFSFESLPKLYLYLFQELYATAKGCRIALSLLLILPQFICISYFIYSSSHQPKLPPLLLYYYQFNGHVRYMSRLLAIII